MILNFYIVDSFTNERYSGNPAGVIFHERDLTEAEMRRIADELHLESAFVGPPPDNSADYSVAYYTGECRVPLCGHDTIALGVVLHERGIRGTVKLHTDVGLVLMDILANGWISMSQALPLMGAIADRAQCAEALGCGLDALGPFSLPVQVVSTGSPFLFVSMRDEESIDSLCLPMPALAEFLNTLPGTPLGCYVFAAGEERLYARCFCPGAGLPEDPVTGSASGALGSYLLHHGVLKGNIENMIALTTHQGYVMGRPGSAGVQIRVDRANAVQWVKVSGQGILVARGELFV